MAEGVVLWVLQIVQSLHEFMQCGSAWLGVWSIQSLFLRSHLQKNTKYSYHTLHYQPKEQKSCHLQPEIWYDPCDTSAKLYSVYTTYGCFSLKKTKSNYTNLMETNTWTTDSPLGNQAILCLLCNMKVNYMYYIHISSSHVCP